MVHGHNLGSDNCSDPKLRVNASEPRGSPDSAAISGASFKSSCGFAFREPSYKSSADTGSKG